MSVQYLLLLLYVGDGSRQKQRLSQCASAEFLAFGKSKEELFRFSRKAASVP